MELKKCFREPIQEVFEAAEYLKEANLFHLKEEFDKAEKYILKADISKIRDWTESIWGKNSPYVHYKKSITNPILEKSKRIESRMPDKIIKKDLINRDGFVCRFCGIPLIRTEIRNKIKNIYPNALKWERKNINQHAAFQAMWLQYDHILPHSRGGNNDLDNLVITCAPCNFGRMQYTLLEVGLFNPLDRKIIIIDWDGLESFNHSK